MNTKQQKSNHKTTVLKVYAAPLVMLVMASAFASPAASADTNRLGYTTIKADFHYSRDAPAEQIYSELRSLVQSMCTTKGPRPLALRRSDQACMASAMKDGISRIGRTDIAALHSQQVG